MQSKKICYFFLGHLKVWNKCVSSIHLSFMSIKIKLKYSFIYVCVALVLQQRQSGSFSSYLHAMSMWDIVENKAKKTYSVLKCRSIDEVLSFSLQCISFMMTHIVFNCCNVGELPLNKTEKWLLTFEEGKNK